MAKLGFLGLGIMGYPMARNLVQAGHDVGLWSHTADKGSTTRAIGWAVLRDSCRDRADAECVFLCVGDSKMSRGCNPRRERHRQRREERLCHRGRQHRFTFVSAGRSHRSWLRSGSTFWMRRAPARSQELKAGL